MKEILNKGASLRFILRQTDPSKFVVIINNGKEETRLLLDLTENGSHITMYRNAYGKRQSGLPS